MQAITQQEARSALRRYLWAVVALALVAVVLTVALSSGQSAGTMVSIFSTRFLGIFIEAAPFLLLGTLASGLIEAFVSRDDIARWVPRNPVLATITGAFMGMVFPVCECGVVPVVRRLFQKGLPMSVGVTFLLAAPVMNPVVLVSTYVAFGAGPVLVGRFALTALVAIGAGLVFALNSQPQEILRPQVWSPVMGGSGEVIPVYAVTKRKPLLVGLRDALRMAGELVFGRPSTASQFKSDIFMIMPFLPDYDYLYQGIMKPLCVEIGLTIRRGDEFQSSRGSIMEEVWAALNACRFVIAEISGGNDNVFYELGIAHTLNKPAILITQARRPEEVPFDVRHLRYIQYDNAMDGGARLRESLKTAIQRLIVDLEEGWGPMG